MADAIVQLAIDGSGKKVDTSELTVGANTVERQRVNISDPTTAAAHASVLNTQPAVTEYGITVRPASSFPDTTTGATSINGNGQVVQIALSGQVGASFQLTGGGTLICTITPQLSIDGGTNWFNTYMEVPGTSQVITSANIGSGQIATQWTVVPAAGASHARLLSSAYSGGGSATFTARAAQIIDSTDEDAGPPGSAMPPIVSAHGAKDPGGLIQALQTTTTTPTGLEQGLVVRNIPSLAAHPAYRATKYAYAPTTTTPTDIFVLTGSASKTIYVTRFQFSGVVTTAVMLDLQLTKHSAANTVGTSSAATIIPLDSGSAAATATCLGYTANPTVGTSLGAIWSQKYLAQLAAAVPMVVDLNMQPEVGEPVVLRGTAQQLALNLNSVTIAGPTFDMAFEWYEV